MGTHKAPIQAMVWHPDGRTLATASDDSTVGLWDTSAMRAKGDPLEHCPGSLVDDVLFTPDGRTLISVVENKQVRFWDAGTHDQAGESIPVSARRLVLSRSGSLLAAASPSDVNVNGISRRS